MTNEKPPSVPAEPKILRLPQKRTGGPQTPAGKAASRRNALKHGMTAKTLLPDIFQPGRVEALRAQLMQNPRSVLRTAVLAEAARHIAFLEVAEKAEEAILREGARLASTAIGAPGLPLADQQICAAVTTPALEAQTRYRRPHERGLSSALRMLALLGNAFGGTAPQSTEVRFEPPRFVSEAACETFLKARFTSDSWRCPRCSDTKAHWLESRKVWECAACKKQLSLRTGTLFERSALPLLKWFYATQLIVQRPQIDVATLAERLGINRKKTVSEMAEKIRAALADEPGRQKFVGIDEVFRRPKVA